MRGLIGIVCLVLASISMWSQVNASAAISIMARLPGSVSVSPPSTPITMTIENRAQSGFQVPVSVEWNLDPRETHAFSVVAYFQDSGTALVNTEQAIAVSAQHLTARWGSSGAFIPFRSGHGATLLHATVLPETRRGKQTQALQVRFDESAAAALPDGEYLGILYLQVRTY